MAISNGSDDNSVSPDGHKPTDFGGAGYYDGFTPDEAEKQQPNDAPRKMSRIDRPVTKSISGSLAGRRSVDGDMESEQSISVGKQMELEAGNAIKYRSCSWQKVRYPHPFFSNDCFPWLRDCVVRGQFSCLRTVALYN